MNIPKEYKLVLSKLTNRKILYLGIAAMIVASLGNSVVPYIYGRLVDVAISPHSRLDVILRFILLWFAISLFSDWAGRRSRRVAFNIATDLTDDLMIDLHHYLLSLPIQFHKERKMGKVIRRVQRGIDDLFNLIESTAFAFFPTIISFIVAITILLFVEWRLSLILIFTSAAYVLITLNYTKEIVKKQRIMHSGWERAYGEMYDSVLNVQTVKSMTNEDYERKRSISNFNRAAKIFKDWRLVWDKMNTWQDLILTTSFITVFSLGIMMLRANVLTPGKLIMFVGYISLLTWPALLNSPVNIVL